jgi:hypothetical protein
MKQTAGSLESVVMGDTFLILFEFLFFSFLLSKEKVCSSNKDITTSHCCRKM